MLTGLKPHLDCSRDGLITAEEVFHWAGTLELGNFIFH